MCAVSFQNPRQDLHNTRSIFTLAEVKSTTLTAGGLSFLIGFGDSSFGAYNHFVRENRYTMFKNPRAAQDICRKEMLKQGTNGGLRLMLKVTGIVGFYLWTTQSMNFIRNDINPLDHALCGGVLGGLYR